MLSIKFLDFLYVAQRTTNYISLYNLMLYNDHQTSGIFNPVDCPGDARPSQLSSTFCVP